MPVIIPNQGQAMDRYDMQAVYNLYSPLIYTTPEGKLKPHIAQDWSIWINTTVPPTDDVHFRRAILYAYDYEAVMGQHVPYGTKGSGNHCIKPARVHTGSTTAAEIKFREGKGRACAF